VVLSFAGPINLDVVFLEGVAGGIYIEDMEHVTRCSVMFDRISDAALSENESAALIGALAKE
jgi:Domain of unknown function (DUF5753)